MTTTPTDLSHFAALLRRREPLNVIKFNDGEFHAMTGRSGSNCDNHVYSRGLRRKLNAAWFTLRDTAYISDYCSRPSHALHKSHLERIGMPARQFNFSALLHRADGHETDRKLLYEAIRDDTRRKIIVAPKRLAGAAAMLGCEHHVIVPLHNAFDSYDAISTELGRHLTSDSIVLFCCGFTSCLLAADHAGTGATMLDIGSGLDPLFVGKTRRDQMSTEAARGIYADWDFEFPPIAHFEDELPGWFNFPDLYDLMIAKYPGGHFVEVGAWMGKSAAYMACEIIRRRSGAVLDIVDHFQGSKSERKTHHKDAQKQNVRGLCANNLRPYWSTDRNLDPEKRDDNVLRMVVSDSVAAARRYDDESLDFVFIDAGHTEAEVAADIAAWLPKVRSGGVLAGHDYSDSFPGVVAAVKRHFPTHKTVSKNCWLYEVP